MAAVKGKDTTPEMIVRRLVHGLGFRYRLHVRALPGNPDMVFPRLKVITSVQGMPRKPIRLLSGGWVQTKRKQIRAEAVRVIASTTAGMALS